MVKQQQVDTVLIKKERRYFTRIYLSYIDSSGRAHTPFVMPQKDPSHYDTFTKSYNFPEFAVGPVPFTERDLLRILRSPAEASVGLPLPPRPARPPGKKPARNKRAYCLL
jgi:hypothetical protein